MLALDPGLGKTSIVLEWIRQMQMFGYASRFLIVAPLRVVYNVWPKEIRGWRNFHHMSYSIVHGTTSEMRKKRLLLPVDIHIINRDGLDWLANVVHNRQSLPWHAIIFDESHGFKKWSAVRSKAARDLVPRIPYRVTMTGTPSPNTLADLFGQIWLLDQGKSLGTHITEFRTNYCLEVGEHKYNTYHVKEGMGAAIKERIKHLVLRLDAKDHLSIPPITYHDVAVSLPPEVQNQYDQMEKEMFLLLASGDAREAMTAGSKYNLCRQIANGGIYDENHKPHVLHHAKTEAVTDLLEELEGKPALIAYQFQHDLDRLRKAIKGLHYICGGMKEREITELIDRWNNNTLDVPYLAVQPQALSEGVNMQKGLGRDIIWYGPTDNLATWLQFNTRIWRQGVSSPVRIHRVWTENTIDDVCWPRLDGKQDMQANLLEFLRAYAKEKAARLAAQAAGGTNQPAYPVH